MATSDTITDTQMNEMLAVAFEDLKIGIHIYRLEDVKDDSSLRMIYANKFSEELIGQKVKNMVGKKIDELFPSIRNNGVPAKYAEVVNTGIEASFEDISYKDKHIAGAFSIRAYRLPYDCVAVMFDNITVRVEAQNELLSEKEKSDQMNAIMVDRELKMIELKKRIKKLEAKH